MAEICSEQFCKLRTLNLQPYKQDIADKGFSVISNIFSEEEIEDCLESLFIFFDSLVKVSFIFFTDRNSFISYHQIISSDTL